MSKITKINFLLALILVLLSFLTITWHNQNRQLYLSSIKTDDQYQEKIAMQKQLLSQRAVKNDGAFIKKAAEKQLNMQQPTAKKIRDMQL